MLLCAATTSGRITHHHDYEFVTVWVFDAEDQRTLCDAAVSVTYQTDAVHLFYPAAVKTITNYAAIATLRVGQLRAIERLRRHCFCRSTHVRLG